VRALEAVLLAVLAASSSSTAAAARGELTANARATKTACSSARWLCWALPRATVDRCFTVIFELDEGRHLSADIAGAPSPYSRSPKREHRPPVKSEAKATNFKGLFPGA